MGSGKKMLFMAGGLVVTVVIIILGFNILNKGRNSSNESLAQYDALMSEYADIKLAAYDGNSVSGSEVVSLIKGLTSETHYTVSVTNGAGTTPVIYKGGTGSESGIVYVGGTSGLQIENKNAASYYINPYATFSSSIKKDANGVIEQVILKQDK